MKQLIEVFFFNYYFKIGLFMYACGKFGVGSPPVFMDQFGSVRDPRTDNLN